MVILLAVLSVSVWIVYTITRPTRAAYLVTPQTLEKVTGPILKATDATWKNHDGTDARGWLIRGADGAPAVILLHGYGADRSWLLNFAVKLNEQTNFTVLWPDLRGHGENPPVRWSLLGGLDGDDVTAAIEYLKTLKTTAGQPQISARIGVYGIELGAYAALDGAKRAPDVRALALDSVPASPDDLIRSATETRLGMKSEIFYQLARGGLRIYGLGKFQSTPSCDMARAVQNVRVMLLSGNESDPWRASSLAVAACFSTPVEIKKDLVLTGANLPNSTGEQEEAYDRPVIEFFDKALR
ncbi:MAG TPA: alpha/beta fold hydrolase [Pyrinomonadaceae bacterium]|nr:alpha/beta fold hydrolase [Pyrinomonadaceae bacterium]